MITERRRTKWLRILISNRWNSSVWWADGIKDTTKTIQAITVEGVELIMGFVCVLEGQMKYAEVWKEDFPMTYCHLLQRRRVFKEVFGLKQIVWWGLNDLRTFKGSNSHLCCKGHSSRKTCNCALSVFSLILWIVFRSVLETRISKYRGINDVTIPRRFARLMLESHVWLLKVMPPVRSTWRDGLGRVRNGPIY